jgi:hypothetical protein
MAGLVVPHGKPLCDGANEPMKKPARGGLWECGRELLRGPRYGKFFCMKSLLFFSS